MERVSSMGMGLLMVGLVSLASIVIGVSIIAQPAAITAGDMVTVDITDLPEGAFFSFQMEGVLTPPSGEYLLRASHFQMPLALEQGILSARAENVRWTRVSVRKGETTVAVRGEPASGIFEMTEAYNVSPGEYASLQIEGERQDLSSPIRCYIQLTGVKQGPDTSRISFLVDGVERGTLRIRATVNGTLVLNQEILIRVTSPGEEGGEPGESAIIPPPITSITVPLGTITPAPTQRTVVSLDRQVEIIAAGENLQVLRIANLSTPGGWELVVLPCRIVPENATFTPPGILSFSLAGVVTDQPLFLSAYEEGEWRMLPSRIENGSISTDIHQGGIYGLMTFASESGISSDRAMGIPTGGARTTTFPPPLAPLSLTAGTAIVLIILIISKNLLRKGG